METQKLAHWLTIVGNLGIVVGLFFVGFQLYQDRQLKQAELSSAYFETRILSNIAAMGEEPQKSIVKAATNPDQMTPEDAYIFLLHADNWSSLWLRFNRLERLGLQAGAPWQEFSGLGLEFSTPIGLRWAERFIERTDEILPRDFVAKLKEQVREPGREAYFQRRLDYLLDNAPLESE